METNQRNVHCFTPVVIGRIRLDSSERKYSLVRSFLFSTALPHEWFRIFRAYERPGIGSRENSSNHVTHKRRPAEFEIRLERPVGSRFVLSVWLSMYHDVTSIFL